MAALRREEARTPVMSLYHCMGTDVLAHN